MSRKIFKTECKSKICSRRQECCRLPLELNSDGKGVDILLIGEYGRKTCKLNNQPYNSNSNTGHLVREIIRRLQEKFKFNYAITMAVKDYLQKRPNSKIVNECKHHIYNEIETLKPKIIVCLGDVSHSIVHDKQINDFNIFNEEGCIRTIKINGKKYKTITSIDPAYLLRKDPCSVGFVYNVLFKACIYYKDGVDFNISNKFNSEYVTKLKDIKALLSDFSRSKNMVAVDTETRNLGRVYDNEIITIQVGNDGNTGYTIPVAHFDSPFSNGELDRVKNLFKDFFTNKSSKISGYILANPKFDMHQFGRELKFFIYNAPIIDINFNAYLLEENWARFSGGNFFDKGFGPFSLGGISYKHGFNFYYKSEGVGKDDRANLSNIPIAEWLDYACADACAPWSIWKQQLKMASYQNYLKSFKLMAIHFNTHLSRTLTYVEHCGLPTNVDRLRELYSPRTSELLQEIKKIKIEFNESPHVKKLVKKLREEKTGYGGTLFGDYLYFDPNSKLHREALFFDVMKLEPVDEKISVDKKFQETYNSIHEVNLMADWNRLNKLQSSYINNIFQFMNKTTGLPDFYTDERVRPTFWSDAVTGRLKASDPNCVNIESMINIEGRLTTFKRVLEQNTACASGIHFKKVVDSIEGKRETNILYYFGEQPSRKIKTSMGFENETTLKTPMLVLTPDFDFEWKFVKDLKRGDYLVFKKTGTWSRSNIKFNHPLVGKAVNKKGYTTAIPNRMTPDFAKILGYLVSEGNATDFGNKDFKVVDDYITTWNKVFKSDRVAYTENRKTTGTTFKFGTVYVNMPKLSEFFDSIGYNTKHLNYDKEIPWSVLESNKKCNISFLQALFEGDGWITKTRIGYSSTSEKLVKQLQVLLLKFGVVSSRYERKRGKGRKSWILDITGKDRGLFLDEIDFVFKTCEKAKTSKLTGYKKNIPFLLKNIQDRHIKIGNKQKFKRTHNKKGYIIKGEPYFRNDLGQEQTSLLMNHLKKGRKYEDKGLNLDYITKDFKKELKKIFPSYGNVLDFILKNDLFFDSIVSLRKSNCKVADFNIEEGNTNANSCVTREGNFVVNGQIIHNSQQRVSRGDRADSILSLYEAKPGRCCGKIDYAAFEVRGLAIESQDKALVQAFIDMNTLKNKFRKNPYSLITKKHKKDALNLKEKLIDSIHLPFFHGSYIHNNIKEWFDGHPAPADVIEKFKQYVLCIVNKDEIYSVNELRAEIEYYFIKEVNYLLSKSILNSNADIHRRSASTFNQVPLDKVTKEMRQNAKGFVFGCIYGRGLNSVAKELGITEQEAEKLFNLFKGSMPKAFKWLEGEKDFGRKNLYVESQIGRRRRVWGFLQRNGSIISKMERLSQNSKIQGFCSDLNIIANSLLVEWIYSKGKGKYQVDDSEAWFIDNLVHDSGEMEFPVIDIYYILMNSEKYFTTELLKYTEKVFGFNTKVPIEIDYDIGLSYADMIGWDGTVLHAKHIQKEMLIREAKRFGVEYDPKLYEKALLLKY